MTDQSESHDTAHSHSIRIARQFPFPVERLWEAWTDNVRLEHWFTEESELDLRVGGRYRNSDGDEGEFLEVTPHERLKFTWEQPDYAPGSVVTVEFLTIPEGTELHLEHDGIGCDDTDDLELGWRWSLDSLLAYLHTGLGLTFEQWAAARGLQ